MFNRRKQDTSLDEAVGHEITTVATSVARELTQLECHLNGIPLKNPEGSGYSPKAHLIYTRHLNQTIDKMYTLVNEVQDILKEMT
jgi:hypothetical protein